MSTSAGTVIYKIRAFDLTGLSSETLVYTIEFVNAQPEPSEKDSTLLVIGGLLFLLVLSGGIGGGAIYLIRRKLQGNLGESTE